MCNICFLATKQKFLKLHSIIYTKKTFRKHEFSTITVVHCLKLAGASSIHNYLLMKFLDQNLGVKSPLFFPESSRCNDVARSNIWWDNNAVNSSSSTLQASLAPSLSPTSKTNTHKCKLHYHESYVKLHSPVMQKSKVQLFLPFTHVTEG